MSSWYIKAGLNYCEILDLIRINDNAISDATQKISKSFFFFFLFSFKTPEQLTESKNDYGCTTHRSFLSYGICIFSRTSEITAAN